MQVNGIQLAVSFVLGFVT